MPKRKNLKAQAGWVQLQTTREDWNTAEPELLSDMLGYLHLVRAFEEKVLELAGAGLVYGPAHSSIGQEGGAVGSILRLDTRDGVNGSHRGHHQFLTKSLRHVAGGPLELGHLVTQPMQDLLQRTLAEILGLSQGFSGGRGGSMHLQWRAAGALGTNAIVGGGIPFAAGNAWAQRFSDPGAVTVTYFGDGAANIGSALETMNLAAAWKLPLCFFIENNLYAVSTHIAEVTAEPQLSARGPGFGIPSWRVDGMDPLAVHLATIEAAEIMRSGGGPTLIEAEVYRFFHQNGSFPGSAFGYRSKEEEQEWIARDPVARVGREMLRRQLLVQDELDAVREQAQNAMIVAVEALIEADPSSNTGGRRIKPSLWPSGTSRDEGIRGDLQELKDARALDPEASDTSTSSEMKFIDAIAGVMDRRMETDTRILVLGEDIHRLKGGTNGATRGLAQKYPDRVLGTPISENSFVGLGGGIALSGRFLPVIELMYADFLWVAADQLFNQIGKVRHMFGDTNSIPLVLRTKVAMGGGYGSQHSMDPSGIFATSAGWRIVAPSTPADYVGLMNTALALNDPTLVLEHIDLYDRTGLVPENDLDYQLPFGRAAVRKSGSDLTLLTFLSMVNESLNAAKQADLDVEVVDLRWLDRASLDWETIGESVRKTNRVLIVEQGALGPSYGGWLADEIQRRYFDWLDQPILRVTGGEASPTISRVLDRAAIARSDEVLEGIRRAAAEKGGK